MVFFYEVINTVLNYQKVGIAQANSSSVSDISSFLFQIIFWTHLIGFLISLLGTKTLLDKLGERLCLLLIPIATGLLLFYFMFNYTQFGMLAVLIIMRAINYGFSYPVRESFIFQRLKKLSLNQNPGLMLLEVSLPRLPDLTLIYLPNIWAKLSFLMHIVSFLPALLGFGWSPHFCWVSALNRRLPIMRLLGLKKNRIEPNFIAFPASFC